MTRRQATNDIKARDEQTLREVAAIESQLMTASELAAVFGCSARHVRDLVRDGKLPAPVTPDRRFRFGHALGCYLMYIASGGRS